MQFASHGTKVDQTLATKNLKSEVKEILKKCSLKIFNSLESFKFTTDPQLQPNF